MTRAPSSAGANGRAAHVGEYGGSWDAGGLGPMLDSSGFRGRHLRIETQVRVAAPPRTVFEFFAWLDHLRLVSPAGRREWCPTPGRRIAEGVSHEVCLEQGRHRVRLRFSTETMRAAECIVDVFSSWPLDGARRTLRFFPDGPAGPGSDAEVCATRVVEEDEWRPPLLVRPLVDKRLEQQRSLFEEKLNNARRIIETVYPLLGPEAFSDGVVEPARKVGFEG